MLYIVTGTPGAGKTLFTLSRLIKDHEEKDQSKQRPIFVHGIPDLNYEFFHADELTDPEKWYEKPDGSIIVFDEAQTVFPQRPASQKVPRTAQEFSTHRHKGMDIYIITQDGSNIDAFVRRMCGTHYHVHRILRKSVATVYEYDHYESRPTGYHEKQQAISKSAWPYPKKLYDKYKSATIHTVKSKTPLRLYLLIGVLFVTAWAIYAAWSNFSQGRFAGDSAADKMESGLIPGIGGGAAAPSPGSFQTPGQWINKYRPRIEGILESAPIYDGVESVSVVPRPLCVLVQPFESGPGTDPLTNECFCYTQQLTKYETTDSYCRSWAMDGYFNHSKSDSSAGPGGGSKAQARTTQAVY